MVVARQALWLALLAFAAPGVGASCPQDPPDCYSEEEPPEFDIAGIAGWAGVFPDEEDEDTTTRAFILGAVEGQQDSQSASGAQRGRAVFKFAPGTSDPGTHTHVNVTVRFDQSPPSITWTNGTSREFQFDLASEHYEVFPFEVTREAGSDIRLNYTVVAHEGQPDEVSESGQLVIESWNATGYMPANIGLLALLGVLLVMGLRRSPR